MNIKHLRRVIGNAVCGDLHRMPQQELDEAIDALDELEKLARQQESEGVVDPMKWSDRTKAAVLAALQGEGVVVGVNDNLPGMGSGPDCVSIFAVDGSQPFRHGQRWLATRIEGAA